MSKHLPRIRPVLSAVPKRKRPKGWSVERRVQQAALIRRWQPWRHSTGPRTELGKARCALNARSRAAPNDAYALAVHRARKILRLAARNLAILRALKRAASFPAEGPLRDQGLRYLFAIRYSLLGTRIRRTE